MDTKFSEVYLQIGQKIKARRLELQFSQEQLAQKIPKMDRSKISDMENGKEDYLFSTLLKVCKALEINVFDLLKWL